MDPLEDRSAVLWADLAAAALQPLDVSEIADLFAVIARVARSDREARRLGPTRSVVRLAAAVVAGRHRMGPETSATLVVVAAYLAEPALSDRWFGYSLTGPEGAAFASLAARAFAADLAAFLASEAGQ